MSETRHARLGISSPSALGTRKPWKKAKQKVYIDDYRRDFEASSSHSTPSYESDGGEPPNQSPSLIDRLGIKVAPRRSLLERMELEGSEPMEAADTGAVHSFGSNCMPPDAVSYSIKMAREAEGEINDAEVRFSGYRGASEEGQIMADTRPASFPSGRRTSWNGLPTRRASRPTDPLHDSNTTSRNANPERANAAPTSEPAVNSNHNGSREAASINNHAESDTPMPFADSDTGPAPDASNRQSRPPLPLQARISRGLRSAVFQNARLRDKSGTMDENKVQSNIDALVTDTRADLFGAQMRKVKHEMDALRAGRQTEETMTRAKDGLLNGFGSKSGTGDYTDNTWLNRRDSHSLIPSLASTSILPTPPSSESLPAENMSKQPPKGPRALMGVYSSHLPSKSTSLKGKEKAIDPLEDRPGSPRERRNSYAFNSLRAEPMQNVPSDNVPLNSSRRERSPPYRRASASQPRSSRRRSFVDEMLTYRSPPSSRTRRSPPPRTDSAPRRVTTRSPARRSRSRSRSRPHRAVSHTRSFNSRRPSLRSPSRSRSPPPSATRSNGSPRRAPSRESSRGRTFSGKRPPPSYTPRSRSPILNSRHPYEKRPFVRSPSPYRTSTHTRSPPPRRRKLTHLSRSPSVGGGPRARYPSESGRAYADSPRRASAESPRRAYAHSPVSLQSPFSAHPPSTRLPDSSPALPPPPPPPALLNPCNTVPNLWFVKVGADTPRVVEGEFVIEPAVAGTWGILPPSPPTHSPNPELRVALLCVPTVALITLSNSLRAADARPTPESMAAAVAGLASAWPPAGTLILDMNQDPDPDVREGGGLTNGTEKGTGKGRTWLPRDIDPTAPLDVTEHLRPGRNVIRFIQLAGMEDHTFILCAARREPEPIPVNPNIPPNADLDLAFDDPPTAGEDALFNFSATVSILLPVS